jgi:hypothetical protein
LTNHRVYAIIKWYKYHANMSKSPDHNKHPQDQPYARVSEAFRIGHPQDTIEEVIEGRRYLRWVSSNGDDKKFKRLAQWSDLPHGKTSEDISYIEVPEGTRSAASVLSGMEAWSGEKSGVVSFLSQFVVASAGELQGIDGNASLDTIAVTKDQKMFVSPPHKLITDPALIGTWLEAVCEDIIQVVGAEPEADVLVDQFLSATTNALEGRS